MLNKIIAEIEALKVEDDSAGLKRNILIDKVLEILRKPQEPCRDCPPKDVAVSMFTDYGGCTVTPSYCPCCGRKLED